MQADPSPRLHLAWVVGRLIPLLVAVAALGAAAVFYVESGSFAFSRVGSPEVLAHTDFETFWHSAVALLDGQDIYRTDAALPNLNPPVQTLLLAPLGWLDFWLAYRLFVLVTIALVVASMAAVAAELRIGPGVAVTVTGAALLSSPVLASLGLGQVYGIHMAGLAAAWVLHRRGRPVLEGLALGMVVALKPSLAPVLIVPLVRRQWDALAMAVATAGLATIIGWIAAGLASMPDWVRLVLTHPVQAYFDNASLPGAVLRLTSATDSGRPIVELPGGAVIGVALGIVLIAVTAWMAGRERADADTALWAMAAAALLASPLSWHNYLMLLLPATFALIARGRWPYAAALLALTLIGMEWPPYWFGPDGASAIPLSLYCAILLAFWAALVPWRTPRGHDHSDITLREKVIAPPRLRASAR